MDYIRFHDWDKRKVLVAIMIVRYLPRDKLDEFGQQSTADIITLKFHNRLIRLDCLNGSGMYRKHSRHFARAIPLR